MKWLLDLVSPYNKDTHICLIGKCFNIAPVIVFFAVSSFSDYILVYVFNILILRRVHSLQ